MSISSFFQISSNFLKSDSNSICKLWSFICFRKLMVIIYIILKSLIMIVQIRIYRYMPWFNIGLKSNKTKYLTVIIWLRLSLFKLKPKITKWWSSLKIFCIYTVFQQFYPSFRNLSWLRYNKPNNILCTRWLCVTSHIFVITKRFWFRW